MLELLARGYLYKEIAEMLKISVPTVNTYIRRIYEKLHVRSRAQAVAKYAQPAHGFAALTAMKTAAAVWAAVVLSATCLRSRMDRVG